MKLATDEQNYLQELPVCFYSSKAPESWICLSKVFEMPLQRANISKWTLQLQSSSFFQEHWEVSTDLIAVQEQSFGFSNADFLPVQEKAPSCMSRIILFQAFPLEKKKKKIPWNFWVSRQETQCFSKESSSWSAIDFSEEDVDSIWQPRPEIPTILSWNIKNYSPLCWCDLPF